MSALNVYDDVSRQTGFKFFLPLGQFIAVWPQTWKWSKPRAIPTQAISPWKALGRRLVWPQDETVRASFQWRATMNVSLTNQCALIFMNKTLDFWEKREMYVSLDWLINKRINIFHQPVYILFAIKALVYR